MDIAKYLQAVQATINDLDPAVLGSFANHIEGAYNNNQTIYIIGNGGSAANASHLHRIWPKAFFLKSLLQKP